MPGKYELKNAAGGQFMFNLKAANGEKILTSENYTTKAGAERGIQSVRVNSPLDSQYDRRTANGGAPYFVLKAGNNEVLGRSEMYSTVAAREAGISSVKVNGPTAPVEDQTR